MTRRPRGRLVALEGIDGTGKSTLQRRLAARLRGRGYSVALWHEPVDRNLGHRAQVLARDDAVAAAVGFTLDRMIARPRLVRLLERYDVVLADRSLYSTLAYQGSTLPASGRRSLAALQVDATVPPHMVLWLRLAPSEALARVSGRGAPRAPLERARTLERVARAYAGFAHSPSWWTLDARQDRAALAVAAERRLVEWLPPPRPRRRRRGG